MKLGMPLPTPSNRVSTTIVFCVAVMLSAVATSTFAEEEEAPDETAAADPLTQQPKQRLVENPVADPERVPTKEDWRNERERRDQKTLFAPPGGGRNEQWLHAELQEQILNLKRQQEELIRQRALLEDEYRRTHAEIEKLKNPQSENDVRSAALQKQLELLEQQRTHLAELAARQANAIANPLPKDAVTQVFSLQHSQAAEIAPIVHEIVGDRGLRMGVDQRSNSLIISASEGTSKTVEALLQRLDRPSRPTEENRTAETLQLRTVWLLDIDDGMQPSERLVSPHVVDALQELGFVDPRVVCQQVTTLTLGENNRGQFQFAIPVLIKGQVWQFGGKGTISSMAGERFALQFNLEVESVRDRHSRAPDHAGLEGELGGSIYTPLRHYTVMGTTTFVANLDAAKEDESSQQRQRLSAFVVYLDRAREFPAAGAESQNRDDR